MARIVHVGSERVLAHARIADRPVARMIGLLAHRTLDSGDGLVLRPCASIHTCFMRFAIDVAFVDAQGLVVHVVERMRPFRMSWASRAREAIELPAGTLAAAGVSAGQRIRIEAL
jgi:uncharacterized membrane protein (UPF0127 family)